MTPPLDFPASPTVGATYTTPAGVTYTFDGVSWITGTSVGITPPPPTVTPAAPDTFAPLFNRVKSSVPGATDAMIRQEINAVLVDFTQDTNLWREEVVFTTLANTLSYPLTMTSGQPNRLMYVFDPLVQPLRPFMGGIAMRVPGTLVFYRQPEPGKALTAIIAKAASVPVTSTGYYVIDSWIINKYADVLYYGALSYLQMEPSKTYSDPKLGSANAARYHSGKGLARAEGIRENLYGGQTWSYPQGWASIGRKGWA